MAQRHRLRRIGQGAALLIAGLWLAAGLSSIRCQEASTRSQTASMRSQRAAVGSHAAAGGNSSTRGGRAEVSAALLPVQWRADTRLAKGKLLVASRELLDPNFEETVILLVDYNERATVGLVVNRTTKVKLAELLPDVKGLKERSDTIYAGGPVSREEILMLVRSAHAPEDARPVFGEVYVTSSADLLEKLVAEAGSGQGSSQGTAPFRVYSGYAGWAPGQLEDEVDSGSWHIFPANTDAVFSRKPEEVWHLLIERTTLHLASLPAPPATAYRPLGFL